MTVFAIETATRQIEDFDRSRMVIRSFFDETTFTASHVVHDPDSRLAAIIDPVLDYDPSSGRTSHGSANAIVDYIRNNDLTVDWLLETHTHADHLTAAPYLQDKVGGKIAIGHLITTVQGVFAKLFNTGDDFRHDGSQFDRLFEDGDQFYIGSVPVIALHVPGHTPADLAYVVGDSVFVGDTLFMPDYGTARCDFPGGDAKALYQSIQRILSLPSLLPGMKFIQSHFWPREHEFHCPQHPTNITVLPLETLSGQLQTARSWMSPLTWKSLLGNALRMFQYYCNNEPAAKRSV